MAPVTSVYWPAMHAVQLVDAVAPVSVGMKVPNGQPAHTLMPVSVWNLPGVHGTHTLRPVVAAMRPAAQFEHTAAPESE
jgi:hypothetical protein